MLNNDKKIVFLNGNNHYSFRLFAFEAITQPLIIIYITFTSEIMKNFLYFLP